MNIPEDSKWTLEQARKLNGYKQGKAAKELGISTDTLRSYECGKTYPDVPMIRKIEKLYGIPYDRIIFLPFNFGLTEVKNKEAT